MFKVEFFVDDKRLGAALNALVGISYGQPSVLPVVNAVKTGNGLAPVTAGSSLERLAGKLKAHKGKEITHVTASEILKTIGLSPSSKNYMLQRAAKAGLVRKLGRGSRVTYKVM